MFAGAFRKLKDSFHKLKQGEPGKRFMEHYERHRRSEKDEGKWKTIAYIAAGTVLLIGGLLLSIPPGLPGFLLWVPALGLLVARLKVFAAFMDRAELLVWRVIDKFRK